jgi:hypothetical protein
MGGRIPKPIRRKVMRAWLEGKPRDKIAEEIDRSTGAVSSIVNDFRNDDPEFDLLREVAVEIKNQNLDIKSFAPLVRLYEVLREKELLTGITGQESLELMQDRLEGLVVNLEVLCFKKKLSIEEFVSLITNVYNTADKLGIRLDRFPTYITELEGRIDVLRKEIEQIDERKQNALNDCGMTLKLLEEYNANKPFLMQIRKLKQEKADAEEKQRQAEKKLETEILFNEVGEQLDWSISEDELGLGRLHNFAGTPSLNPSDLKEMVMDVFHHPSRYVEVIKQMKSSKLQYEETGITASTYIEEPV